MQYVYILKCNDGTFYTGCTKNLKNRLSEHHAGKVKYTKDKLPFTLSWSCCFTDKTMAFQFEKYLKSGSGIAFRNKRLV